MIEVLSAGFLTTIQDRGRFGYQSQGITTAGAMDELSLAVANALVGNPLDEACIEFMLVGPTIRFKKETIIAITGGEFDVKLNGKDIPMWEAIYVRPKDVLQIGGTKVGMWGYIAIAGGLDVPVVMGSKSTDLKAEIGGYKGRALKKGDKIPLLPFNLDKNMVGRKLDKEDIPPLGVKNKIRVIWGSEDDHFTEESKKLFITEKWTITDKSNRIGYRLEGKPLKHNEKGAEIISDGIALGSIQVPGNGLPIVLLKDRQAVGGYSKIATVISADIPFFVQLKPGSYVQFEPIDIDKAIDERKKMLDFIKNPPIKMPEQTSKSFVLDNKTLKRYRYKIKVNQKIFYVDVEEE